MRRWKKGWPGWLCLLCFCLSGCSAMSFDVRSQLVPPTATGDEEKIQRALEAYVDEEYGAAQVDRYKLKYPRGGDYRTAFIVRDVDADGADEAVVFYAMDEDTAYVHVNYLRKIGDEWQSVGDFESESTSLAKVQFGDMNGDGKQELLAGFELSSLKDSRLTLFELSKLKMTVLGSYLYTDFYLGNLSSEDWQDLLVLRADYTESGVTAQVVSLRDGKATELGSVSLDGYIRSFEKVSFCAVTDTVAGVYVDGKKDNGERVTELICWDGTTLTAPFYDEETNLTQLTARNSGIAMTDVDADGVAEWPQSERLDKAPEAGDKATALWLTRWCSFDYETKQPRIKLYSVVVPEDGYLFVLDESWAKTVSAAYDAGTHQLTLGYADKKGTEKPAVVIRTQSEAGTLADGERTYETVTLQSGQTFYVWFDAEAGFGTELSEILYRITVLS